MIARLEAKGFQHCDERNSWNLKPGGRYYLTRNDSAIIAFKLGPKKVEETGFRIVGAHTDSPCLKVKPQPEITQHGFFQLGVDVYGGVLLSTWFDRDLSLAGKVTFMHKESQHSCLVNFQRPIAYVPNLAIHLHRGVNDGWAINKQTEMPPILAQLSSTVETDFRCLLKKQIEQEHNIHIHKVLDYDLSFYDTQKPSIIGLNDEFISSARLDNLLSCYAGLEALLQSTDDQNTVLICTDHEEIGSKSSCGADGPMLEHLLRRIAPSEEQFVRTINQSILISADNAHALHPNYVDRSDLNHAPYINQGPVIKRNSDQHYATNSETSGFFRYLCESEQICVQDFVVRSDMKCGSTIGPIIASKTGIRTVDIGLATFGMHSIRELAGSHDLKNLVKALTAFYNTEKLP
ncbi:UNVERIFIED_CONTAM: hypothetical protein GTU68_008588 [Idotea baltica]|nr:hypothetical protein [Idotea baltica]